MSDAPKPRSGRAEMPPDNAEPRDAIPDDPRLAQAVREYLKELESGRTPDRRQWLDRYSDLADVLDRCLDGLELVHQAAPLASPLSGNVPRLMGSANDPISASPLGDFQIVREIGRGGMGIVYEAIQLSLGRRVALKVLPFAATFDAKHLQRFRQEAQAAAQLHHTNIVPVYAVGCERGIHFYAMQLIEGQSLDVLVRQLRQEAGLGPLEGGSGDASSLSRRGNGEASPSPSINATRDWTADAAGPCAPRRRRRQALTGSARRKRNFRPISPPIARARSGNDTARSHDAWPKRRKPWNMPISKALFTATSSRQTC